MSVSYRVHDDDDLLLTGLLPMQESQRFGLMVMMRMGAL